jgi:hypothetical protein
LKYRFAGGTPYTPFDLAASQQNFVLLNTGILDYSQLNSLRLKDFNQLDLRIDKNLNYKKTSWNIFLDFQNILMQSQQGAPYYMFERNEDNTGFATTDGQPLKTDGSNGIPVVLENFSTTLTPTIGFTIEF